MVGVQVLQFQVQEVAREYSCACETAVVVVAVWVVTGLLTLSAVPAASTGLVMRPLTSKTCMWMLWAVEPIETVTVVGSAGQLLTYQTLIWPLLLGLVT